MFFLDWFLGFQNETLKRQGEMERRRENVVDFVMSNISRVQFEACQPGGPSTERLWDDIKWAAFDYPLEVSNKAKTRKAFDTIL